MGGDAKDLAIKGNLFSVKISGQESYHWLA